MIAFAAGLKHRTNHDGYDATVLPRGLKMFGDGWSGDQAQLEMCWAGGQRMVCTTIRTQRNEGPLIRPNMFDSGVQRVDINGHEAFLQDSTITWQVSPKSAIDVTAYGLSVDELLTIARSVAEVDIETFRAAWTAAEGR